MRPGVNNWVLGLRSSPFRSGYTHLASGDECTTSDEAAASGERISGGREE